MAVRPECSRAGAAGAGVGGAAGAVQGVGLRSNYQAVTQLMEEDLIGARRVAVVRDDFEQNQVALTPPTLSPSLQGLRCLRLLAGPACKRV